MTNHKCIRYKCPKFWESDWIIECCALLSKWVLLDKCHGLEEIINRKETIACEIQKLTKEYDELCQIESKIKENQC